VGKLRDDEREVFDLHNYDGLTQAEVAQVLDLSPKKVSRLWISATARLTESLLQDEYHMAPVCRGTTPRASSNPESGIRDRGPT
jgi:predicted DNA-binding protein (UPF0251 family)